MASEAAESQRPSSAQQEDDDGKDDSNQKKANIRKRTKTGCLSKSPSFLPTGEKHKTRTLNLGFVSN